MENGNNPETVAISKEFFFEKGRAQIFMDSTGFHMIRACWEEKRD